MSEQDGGPAFPDEIISSREDGENFSLAGGMSLRDWYAGRALTHRGSTFSLSGLNASEALAVAKGCFVMADAMIEARGDRDGK